MVNGYLVLTIAFLLMEIEVLPSGILLLRGEVTQKYSQILG